MVILAVVLAAVLLASLAKLRRLAELHHGYYGAALVAVPNNRYVQYVGLTLLLDDTVQHAVEALGLRPRMSDFTPIHKIGAWLMGIDWKKQGMWLPLAIGAAMFAAAVFCAVHFGV